MSEKKLTPETETRSFNLERAKEKIEQQWQKLSTKARIGVVVLSLVSLGVLSATGVALFREHQAYKNFNPGILHDVSPGLVISGSALGKVEWSKECQWELSKNPNKGLEELMGMCEGTDDRVSFFNVGAKDLVFKVKDEKEGREHYSTFVIRPGEQEIFVSIRSIVEIKWAE